MLAALLLNVPRGGAPKAYDEEKADRYLKTLREEYFERQEQDRVRQEQELARQSEAKAEARPRRVERIVAPSITAVDGVAESDDDLALLLILAEI